MLAEQKRPDAIVLDVRLPGIDGLTAMGKLQSRCGDVPIIVITAYGESEHGGPGRAQRRFRVSGQAVRPAGGPASDRAGPAEAARRLGRPGTPVAIERSLALPPAIQEVFKRIAMVAPSEACVHLEGKAAPARNSSPARFTATAGGRRGRSWRSTWPR